MLFPLSWVLTTTLYPRRPSVLKPCCPILWSRSATHISHRRHRPPNVHTHGLAHAVLQRWSTVPLLEAPESISNESLLKEWSMLLLAHPKGPCPPGIATVQAFGRRTSRPLVDRPPDHPTEASALHIESIRVTECWQEYLTPDRIVYAGTGYGGGYQYCRAT